MKAPNPRDRRVQRTHRTLRDALISLILERGWDELSVQDICDRADVGRSTFYTHFADKEELLHSGFDGLHRMLRDARAASTAGGLSFVGLLIEHIHQNRRLWRALAGRRAGQIAVQRIRQLVVELMDEELDPTIPPGPRRDATARYLAGAFVELVVWWLDGRTSLDAAALEDHLRRLTAPVLTAARALR